MHYTIPESVKNILDKFQKANFQIFIVGGAVRDLIMGKPVSDWDFTTDAKPEEILALFPGSFYDNKFGTVGIPSETARGDGEKGIPTRSRSERLASEDARRDIEPAGPRAVYEITTMRKEGKYEDFRHPGKIIWTNKIEEDLSRRDFTVNAIALGISPVIPSEARNLSRMRDISNKLRDPSPCTSNRYAASLITQDDKMKLVDPFHGQNDINNKIIRAVGNPDQRFKEDALRLIRAIRIAAELEFEIETITFQAIKKNIHLLKEIAWERIRDELFKLLASVSSYMGINKLREAGVLQIILPELENCFGIVQQGPKHDRVYDIGEHSLLALKHTPSTDPLVKLGALLHDIGKTDTVKTDPSGNVTFYNHDIVGGKLVLKIARRLNLSKKQTDKLYCLVRWHLFTVDEHQTDSAIRRFIKNVGVENIADMMALRIGDRLGGGTQKAVSWRMEKFESRIKEVLKKPFSLSDLKVNGTDVMKVLNIKPGPKVGEILNKLFEEVLEDSAKNNKEYLLNRIGQIT